MIDELLADWQMTKLKALSVLQCREYVLDQHGDDGIRRIQAALSPAARACIYADDLISTDWVEMVHAVAHAHAYEQVYGNGDGAAAARMVREITAMHFNGLYRPVFAAASTPLEVLERSSRLWNRFYDQGESQIEIHGESSVTKRVFGCPDMPRGHDCLTSPYYEELVKQCGARDVVCKHTRCVALGADRCETTIRWK
jgi:hypothetical protein